MTKYTTPTSGAADLPDALRLAGMIERYNAGVMSQRIVEDYMTAAAELRRQHARITELESQLAQRFDAADMATAAAQGFRDGAAKEQQAGWQPIETAPRDGTEILLYAPACVYEGAPVEARTTYGKWLAPSDTPRIKYQDGFAPELEWDEFDAHWVSWDGGFTPEHSPTHWMPLPAAPGPADGESNG